MPKRESFISRSVQWRSAICIASIAALELGTAGIARARGGEPEGGGSSGGARLAPLSTVPVPQPTHVDYVDKAAAQRLGKALFWDVQAGSDGQTACATCHASA